MQFLGEIRKNNYTNKLSVHFTVNRLNIHEIIRLPYFLLQLGIYDIGISTIKPAGRAKEHPELLIEPDLLPLAREKMRKISTNKLINFHKYNDKSWSGVACPAAFTKCGITFEGKITPCVFLGPEFIGGSIKDHSLERLWNYDAKILKLRNIGEGCDCFGCPNLPDRNGGCRARALYYEGSVTGKDPYCCQQNKESPSVFSLEYSLV
jgi:radical SAM protein with 4Fe4S-binding SPASM domain